MNYARIEQLLKRYFDGETSLNEEQELRSFFSGKDVPVHLNAYKPLFLFQKESAEEQIKDAGFDNKLSERLATVPPDRKHKIRKRISWYFITAAAACLLLIITFFVPMEKIPVLRLFSSKLTDTFNDPEKAYRETVKALLLVSDRFNAGTDKMKELSKFDQGVNDASMISRLETGVTEAGKLDNINTGLKEISRISKINDKNQNN